MKIIGFLIIVNAIILTAWWVSSDHAHKMWVVSVCVVCLFTGSFLMLQDRAIEISFKGLGTIKAAQQQAITDANAIAGLKERVEAQSATVDLVAKSASDARKLVDDLTEKNKATDNKLAQVDESTHNAQEALKYIEKITDFATILLAAQNDSWQAFEQLRKWIDDKSFPLHEVAVNAFVKIRVSYLGPITPGYANINWRPGVDPSKFSCVDFMNTYSTLDPIFHAHLVQVFWNRSDIPKRERMRFLVEVLKTSNSLTAKNFAAKYFVEATEDNNLKWQPFHIDILLRWWEEHSDSIQ